MREEAVKSPNDWIVDLYYKEMVAQKNMEKNHGQHSKTTDPVKKTSKGDRELSRRLSPRK